MKSEQASCISCGQRTLLPVLDFGETPLADRLLRSDQLDERELRAHLELGFCPACALAQLTESVSPEILFCQEYPYFSSVSPSLLRHFRMSAIQIINSRKLKASSLVMEAASNDGYMLKTFVGAGIKVLGIDPASGPARIAQQRGVPTLITFFTESLAQRLKTEGNQADVFLANNVLAHVPDLNGFVEGISIVLKETGAAIIEVPYVVDLVDHVEFDTIYHQHLCYFSVTALDRLFRRHSLFLNRIEHTSIHGGSLRLFVEKHESVDASVTSLLTEERSRKADRHEFFIDFAGRATAFRRELKQLLGSLKAEGKSIAGYGAAAKATTMMSFVGIDASHLNYVADLNTFKQGRFMGGNHLPIVSPQRIVEDMPDYVLILAWNFAEEIMGQLSEYAEKGGKFIVPLPSLRIVERDLSTNELASSYR